MLGIVGLVAVSIALVVLGLLSQRMGSATQVPPYHIGLFAAALLVLGGVLARLIEPTPEPTLFWTLMYNGLPALGVTLGVIVAWRYWSWLLAERN